MGHTEHRQNLLPVRRVRAQGQKALWLVPALVALGITCCTGAHSGEPALTNSTGPQSGQTTTGQPSPSSTTSSQTNGQPSGSGAPAVQTVPAPAFDKSAAWAYLVKQCAFGPRVPGTNAHIACRDYLLKELAKYTDNAHLVEFTHYWSYGKKTVHMWNIVGDQNWKDAKVRVLLTAHWDCRPFSFEDESPMPPSGRFNSREHYAPILGADDAASGIAVMLQLAKEIKDKHPGVGIEFMLNDGEDLGPGEDEMYLGVTDYIKHLPSPKPNYGILLDMIGNKGVHVPLDSYSISNPGTKPILDAFFAEANRVGLGSTFPINDERSNVIDDNKALTEGGVPTIDLIDFSYPYWHTLGDTVDKCSPEALEVIGQALKAWFTKSEPYNPKG